ncbi:cytochrome P450 2J5-like isoform X1 [Lissotriton helveticus]
MLLITELFIALFLTLFIANYLKLQRLRRRYPPGPAPLPIIGNLWTLNFVLHYDTLMQLAKTYGNVFTVWLGQKPVVVLNGCQAIRDGLISHSEELVGRPKTPTYQDLTRGKGVIFSTGHNWKQQRRFGLMTLRNLGVGKKSLEVRIQEEAQTMVEFFAMTKGKSQNPSPAIIHSVTNVISVVIFGHHFSRDDKEFPQLIKANYVIASRLGSAWGRLFDAYPWLMRHIPGPHQDIFKSNAFMEKFVKKEIQSHKEKGVTEDPQDVIDFYQTKISRDPPDVASTFDEHNMVRLAAELFLAGTETTTTTLRWALLYMVKHPEIQGADRMIPLQRTTSRGMHDILAEAVKSSQACPSDDAEEEDDRTTTSAGQRGIRGENPLILQAVMSAASHVQEEEEDHEGVDFVDDDDYISIHSGDDDSDVTASHPPPSNVRQPPPKPQHRANQPQLTRITTQTSLPHSPHVLDRHSGSPTRSSLHSVSLPFSPPSVGSTSPVVQVSPGHHSPAHSLPPATPLVLDLLIPSLADTCRGGLHLAMVASGSRTSSNSRQM